MSHHDLHILLRLAQRLQFALRILLPTFQEVLLLRQVRDLGRHHFDLLILYLLSLRALLMVNLQHLKLSLDRSEGGRVRRLGLTSHALLRLVNGL